MTEKSLNSCQIIKKTHTNYYYCTKIIEFSKNVQILTRSYVHVSKNVNLFDQVLVIFDNL